MVPLVVQLLKNRPQASVYFTNITSTGHQIAVQKFAGLNNVGLGYFPVDLSQVQRKTIKALKPKAIVVVDTEIWPNLVYQAQKLNVPVILVNGRISDRSFPKYLRFKSLMRPVLAGYTAIFAASPIDAERLITLGAPRSIVRTVGNLKYNSGPGISDRGLIDEFRKLLRLDESVGAVVVAGSTHPGEEELILKSFGELLSTEGHQNDQLILAPRHPVRSPEVRALCEKHCLTYVNRTDHTIAAGANVVILDTVGELSLAYSLGQIAIVGGSFIDIGGHSVFEPANAHVPIVVGPYMHSIRDIVNEFVLAGAIVQINPTQATRAVSSEQVTSTLLSILDNNDRSQAMVAAADAIVMANRGSVRRTLESIEAILDAM